MNNTIFEVPAQLLKEKLEFIKIKPNKIGVLGSDYSSTRNILDNMYTASIIEMDVNKERYCIDEKKSWLGWLKKQERRFHLLSSEDLDLLDTDNNQYELIISNLYLVRIQNQLSDLLNLCKQLMKTDGLLFFSFLGLDSFKEIYTLFDQESSKGLPAYHRDMHDVGDELVKSGFIEPVISRDSLSLVYQTVEALMCDLTDLGVLLYMLDWLNIDHKKFEKALEKEKYKSHTGLCITYEFIFAHAIYNSVINSQIEQEVKFYSI